MVKNNHLQKKQESKLPLIPITRTSDLLKAAPLSEQLIKHGKEMVFNHISLSLVKCVFGLSIELSQDEIQLLIEDIMDKYNYESIEDIQQCLKKGRQGNYGPTYGKMNMIIISDWMSKHLEEKAMAREQKAINFNKKDIPQFKTAKEYHDWVKQGFENQKELTEVKNTDQGYDEFKKSYDIESMKKDPGYIVTTKDGKEGRTYNSKELIKGKIPVYLVTKYEEVKDHPDLKIPIEFSNEGILCDPNKLKITSYID